MSIRDNLKMVQERIARAAESVGRDISEISVVGVTKTHGPEVVIAAVEAGIEHIGENRVQEFLSKYPRVDVECKWHLVGHLQRNKVNKVLGKFELIHSIDSERLVKKLNESGERDNIVSNVLIQVNTSGEESKFGVSPDETLRLAELIAELPYLRIHGLMTIAPWVDDQNVVAASFTNLRNLRDKLVDRGFDKNKVRQLSMGMTDDFEIAVKEGATILRLGRVLFGERGEY
jgi:pyridoxal phosphate enzyme (YggS family)